MKNLTYLILSLTLNVSIFAQLSVSPEVSITESLGNYHPQLELTTDGHPIVLWTSGSTNDIYVSKENNGEFLNPIKLNPAGLEVQSYTWSGPDIAVENNNVYVIFRSLGYETGHVYLMKSKDNGQSFSDTMRVDFLANGYAQYPDIALYNDTIFTIYMEHDAMGMNPQYVLSRSFDDGLTFESPILAGELTGDEACDCCPPEIFVNDKFVMVFFRNNASNIRDIKGVVSLDRGATFTDIANIDDHQWLIQSCPSTGPDGKINASGKAFTAFKSVSNGNSAVYLNEYDLLNKISVSTLNLSGSLLNPNYPQIALKNDTIGVVFEGIGSSTDIFFNYSYSGLNGMDVNAKMNITNISGPQNKPDIAFNDGTFHVVYADAAKLKYIFINKTAGLDKIELSKQNSPSLVFYKSDNATMNLEKGIIYSLSGERYSSNNLKDLKVGTYFYYSEEENQVQRLLILP